MLKINKLYDYSEKIEAFLLKLLKYILTSSVIILVCISSKDNIRKLLLYIGINNSDFKQISTYLNWFLIYYIKFVIIFVAFLIIWKLILNAFKSINMRIQKHHLFKMKESKYIDNDTIVLFKNLYNYFSKKNYKNPIFISGEWGAGKTYAIESFFNDYYKYSSQKVYFISCFGISTLDEFVERIEKNCENCDNSLMKNISYLIGEIPIVGELLKNLLSKKYSINNLKRNSIFIFDNFERIEWSKYLVNGHEIINYENAIKKYDIVVGIIDELIERYSMKVVIIGNEAEMVPDYAYKTFIRKLECKKYTINPKGNMIEDVWFETLNTIVKNKAERTLFIDFFNTIKVPCELIWNFSKENNIRVIHKVFYNYISFIIYLKESNYAFNHSFNEITSIFYTCLIVNIYEKENKIIEDLMKYGNISGFFIGKYLSDEAYNEENEKKKHELRTVKATFLAQKDTIYMWREMEGNHYELREYIKNYINNYINIMVDRW